MQRRLRYHPPTAGWRPTASESTTATTTRAASKHDDVARNARGAAGGHGRRARNRRAARWTSPTPCASCCRAATARWTGGRRPGAGRRHARAPLDGALPARLPFGYHRLHPRGGGETLLVVSPGRCFLPDDLRAWGFAAQLYAARSRASWGIGDLADLARLGALDAQPGRRRADGQSADRADAGRPDRAEPVLPVEPALSQPAVPAHRGHARLGRACPPTCATA